MKVSLNWLKDYFPISQPAEVIANHLTALGLEASFVNIGVSFSDVVLGKVLECKTHENADKLSVCKVDIGDGQIYNIVCGAPNIKSDIYVPVAKVGAKLQNGKFEIKKAKLRGVESHGMICSGKELDFNNDHDGIMILNTSEKLGKPIENILNIKNDIIFELDLTPNRGDCLSHLGVARELGISLNNRASRRSIIKFEEKGSSINDEVKINIDDSIACQRYVSRVIKGVKVSPSPNWLVERLNSIGLSSINNIVDAANYVLMDSGHPMHTFDFDKVSDHQINVRYAKKGEKIKTLDGINRELNDFHLLICDSKKPIALAGIMGGINSEISNDTSNIVLESAYFDPTIIRKGAKVLDLSTDASRRFERDTDIESLVPAINQLTQLILDLAGGVVSKDLIDVYPKNKQKTSILFSVKKCEELLGVSDLKNKIEIIFDQLNIKYKNINNNYECIIPSYRNDLKRDVDLFEEVARVIGYDNIEPSTNFSASYMSFIEDDKKLDNELRFKLQSNGFYEHYSNSLQHFQFTKHFSSGNAIKLLNPLSQDMEYIRNSILPGLLMAASFNEKRQEKSFKLFEIGAIHNESKKSITGSNEKFHLGLLWYGEVSLHWRDYEQRDIFRIKGEITHILNSIGLKNISYKINDEAGLEQSIKIYSGKTFIGSFGSLEKRLLSVYDLNKSPIVCYLLLDIIKKLYNNIDYKYTPVIAYPSISRDIALQVENSIYAQDLMDTIYSNGGKYLTNVTLFDVYQSDDVGDSNKSLAFSLKFQSDSKTLIDSEVDNDLNIILKSLKKLYGAIQR